MELIKVWATSMPLGCVMWVLAPLLYLGLRGQAVVLRIFLPVFCYLGAAGVSAGRITSPPGAWIPLSGFYFFQTFALPAACLLLLLLAIFDSMAPPSKKP